MTESPVRKFIEALKSEPLDGAFDYRLHLKGPLTGVLDLKAVTATPPYWPEFVGVRAGWAPATGLRLLIPPGRTTASGVYYIRETSYSNDAMAVPTAPPPPPENQLTGTVNTDGSWSVVWTSGDQFPVGVTGKQITIAGTVYSIINRFSATQLSVDPEPPVQSGAPYVIVMPETRVAIGALKPESSLTYEDKTSPCVTIAHWAQFSRQLADDLPALESQIESRLLFGLALAEDEQILNGTGTNGQLEGLLKLAVPTTGVTAPVAPAALLAAVAKALAEIGAAGYQPTGVVLNPADFVTAGATPSASGVYPYSPGQTGPLLLWGVPVALSSRMAVGQFLAGAFNPGCQLFDREDASVQLSNQDRDNFVKNLITALAEERFALAIYQPGAFRKAG